MYPWVIRHYFLFSLEKWVQHLMQIVSTEENLQVITNPIFQEKIIKKI